MILQSSSQHHLPLNFTSGLSHPQMQIPVLNSVLQDIQTHNTAFFKASVSEKLIARLHCYLLYLIPRDITITVHNLDFVLTLLCICKPQLCSDFANFLCIALLRSFLSTQSTLTLDHVIITNILALQYCSLLENAVFPY